MGGLTGVLNIGKSSLEASQTALNVIANNIANSGVSGYSRQEAVITTNTTGDGVVVERIMRQVDEFLNSQMTSEKQMLGKLSTYLKGLDQVEALVNEANEETGLNNALAEFFKAAHDLVNNPTGTAERTSLVTAGTNLANLMARTVGSLKDIQTNADKDVESVLSEANTLAARIAELNSKIGVVEGMGQTANDLRDERQRLLEELAEKLDVTYFERADGGLTVFVGSGLPLVEGTVSSELVAAPDPDNEGFLDVYFKDSAGVRTPMTQRIGGGSLGGLLALRDESLSRLIDRYDRLAATIINEVNKVHASGFGLDGSTGLNFFSPLQVTTGSSSSNVGGALIDAGSTYDPTILTRDNYEVRFTSSTTYDIFDMDLGVNVRSGETYVSGSNIYLEGIRVRISDGVSAPQAGDVFTISTRRGAARTMAVVNEVKNDVTKVAAGKTPSPGDNTNALALAELQNAHIFSGGTATLGDYYNMLIGEFAAEAKWLGDEHQQQEAVLQQLENQRESLAGVSLDEELMNVLLYQQIFEASARLIATTGDLLQEVIDLL